MLRRLLLAVLAIGVIGTALAFGVVAYFSTSVSGGVTVTAGTPDLNLDYDDDCDGYDVTGLESFTLTWDDIVPGDTETDCVRINNVGDGALDVYVLNSSFGGNGSLLNDLRFQVRQRSDGAGLCPYAAPNAAQYTSGNGCLVINELASGASYEVLLDSWFVDTGSNQNSLQGQATSWNTDVDGYTD